MQGYATRSCVFVIAIPVLPMFCQPLHERGARAHIGNCPSAAGLSSILVILV